MARPCSGVKIGINIFQSIYYHSSLLLLFHPFFENEIRVQGEFPRDICRKAANDIISLSTQYRKVYTLRQTVIHIPRFIFGAAVILLMDLPSPSPSQAVPSNLVRCIKDLRELSAIWQWCNPSLRHVGELAEERNIDLPREAWTAISSPHIDTGPLGRGFINIAHEFPNQQFHFGRPRSEIPSDIMGNQPGNTGWLNDEEFQYVNTIIAFPGGGGGGGGYDDWPGVGAGM